MARINIELSVTGKSPRTVPVESGTTLTDFLRHDLGMDPTGKSFILQGRKVSHDSAIELKDGDRLNIGTNNTGAKA